MNDAPWLSILIPAYEYPKGVIRIIDSISDVNGVECIVSDDSQTPFVEESVKNHELFLKNKVRYIKNEPSLGAVKNWNKLLELSKGKYILLMHHDEFPENEDFYSKLKGIINSKRNIDLVFLRCSHLKLNSRMVVYHMPYLSIIGILKYFPSFLFLFNVVGSPSNVVLKRMHLISFNENLKWLVDVDWMIRLLKISNNWLVSKDISLISVYNPSNSITNSIRKEISSITISEAREIEEVEGKNIILSSILKESSKYKLIFFLLISIKSILHAFSFAWSLIWIRRNRYR